MSAVNREGGGGGRITYGALVCCKCPERSKHLVATLLGSPPRYPASILNTSCANTACHTSVCTRDPRVLTAVEGNGTKPAMDRPVDVALIDEIARQEGQKSVQCARNAMWPNLGFPKSCRLPMKQFIGGFSTHNWCSISYGGQQDRPSSLQWSSTGKSPWMDGPWPSPVNFARDLRSSTLTINSSHLQHVVALLH